VVLLDFGSTREFPPEFVERYVRISRAMIEQDRAGVRQAAIDIGYLSGDEREDRERAFVDLMLLVGEPIRHDGVYDFEGSRLAARARDAGFELTFRRGFMRAPPPETIFLHRKLAGTFLLCAHIHARVNTRALILPYLDANTPTPG
jgi:predicted unusual protein kinase regulating ubiquinone biosynthesis (AarF/ABC1/UbiB family)